MGKVWILPGTTQYTFKYRFLAFVTKLISKKLLSQILLVLSKEIQSLSDYWVIDLIMTSLAMMTSVTYSVDKSTANLCSLVASLARTTH